MTTDPKKHSGNLITAARRALEDVCKDRYPSWSDPMHFGEIARRLRRNEIAAEIARGEIPEATPQLAHKVDLDPNELVYLRACDQGTGKEVFIRSGLRHKLQTEADRMNDRGLDYFITPCARAADKYEPLVESDVPPTP